MAQPDVTRVRSINPVSKRSNRAEAVRRRVLTESRWIARNWMEKAVRITPMSAGLSTSGDLRRSAKWRVEVNGVDIKGVRVASIAKQPLDKIDIFLEFDTPYALVQERGYKLKRKKNSRSKKGNNDQNSDRVYFKNYTTKNTGKEFMAKTENRNNMYWKRRMRKAVEGK